MDYRVFIVRCWLVFLLTITLAVSWPELALCSAASIPMLLFPALATASCGTATCTSAFVAQYQVVTSGFTNNTCTSCAGYNNTWTLTTTDAASLDGSVANNCYAVAMIDPCLCVNTGTTYNDGEKYAMNCIVVVAGNAAALFSVYFHSNDGFGTTCADIKEVDSRMFRWLEFGTKACGTLSSEDIAYFDASASFSGCNHDGSGAIVTAL